jgi:hypothetical protein
MERWPQEEKLKEGEQKYTTESHNLKLWSQGASYQAFF